VPRPKPSRFAGTKRPADLRARVRAALTRGKTEKALELARELHALEPSAPNRELLRQVHWQRAKELCGQGQHSEAASLLNTAISLVQGDPGWLGRWAETTAAAGSVCRALEWLDRLADAAVRARVLGRLADAAIELGAAVRGQLPAALREQSDLVMRAFAQAEAGRDEAARETLQGIGLQSPFLEWKLFLRGLIAYYQNDDARALDNWQRLNPERLPARLSAPLRFRIDPNYRLAHSPQMQARLQRQADRLYGSSIVTALRDCHSTLADPERLPEAFRLVERLALALRQQAPHWFPRLASCFYWVVVSHGEPEDVARYQRVFGAPADDPQLDRLRALLYEQAFELDKAHRCWQQFEKSVVKNATGWPAPAGMDAGTYRNRVRALIWARMGHNAASIPDFNDLPELPAFLRSHPARPRPLAPGAEQCFRQSLELAPDRLDGYTALLEHYRRGQKPDHALATARRLLERFPGHVPTLQAAGEMYLAREEYDAALANIQEALRHDPLDRRLRSQVCHAHVCRARPLVEAGRYEAARADFRAALALEEPKDSAYLYCKWAACEFKAGDAARAEELLGQAQATGGSRLDVAYQLLIESARLKLPRPVKARFEREFKSGLAEAPTGLDAAAVASTAAAHRVAAVSYYGQKSHERQVLAYVENGRAASFTEEQLARLCRSLRGLEAWQLLRGFAALGRRQFPRNPYFFFYGAEAVIARDRAGYGIGDARALFESALQLAGQMPPGDDQRDLTQEIRQRLQVLGLSAGALSLFEDMLGRLSREEWDDLLGGEEAEKPSHNKRPR
jgi:tetratricopeptide (TPR) repeat protein